MSNARNATFKLISDFSRRGIQMDFDDANTLRRAELTLQRWSEGECGDGNDFASWAIERDEQTGIAYRVTYSHMAKAGSGPFRERIADREAGALRRVKAICEKYGIHFYHQGDPRGCALYVSPDILTDSNYSRGIACCA